MPQHQKAPVLHLVPRARTDVERVRAWWEALPFDPTASPPNRFTEWSIRDLSRATGVPQMHLPSVLWQLLWRAYRPHGAPLGVRLWAPPAWVEPIRDVREYK